MASGLPPTTPVSPFPPPAAAEGQPGYSYGYAPRPPVPLDAQIREWIDVVLRGKWYVLGALLLVSIPVAVWTLLQPNEYAASSRLLVETRSTGLSDVLPDGAQSAFGQDQRPLANELYVLKQSETLAQRVAQRLVRAGETAGGETFPILQTGIEGETASVEAVTDRLLGGYVSATPDGRDVDGIVVTVRSTSPQEAALVANLYAEAYVERTRESSLSSVSASREFLQSQTDSVATELTSREEAARSYMMQEGAVRLDEEAQDLVSQLSSLEASRDAARVQAGMSRAKIGALQAEINRLEPNLARRLGSDADAEKTRLQALLTRKQQELDDIYRRTPALRASPSSDVVALQREIDGLQSQIREQSRQIVGEALAAGGVDPAAEGLPRLNELRSQLSEERVALSGLQSQIGIVSGRIAQYEAQLGRIPSQSVELARLVRDRQSAERLKMALEERLQEARVAESAELGYAEVVRSAKVPGFPVGPNRKRHILLGILLGLGLGLTIATVRSRLDRRLHDPEDLKALGLPVLGTIPAFEQLIKEDFGGAETVAVDGRQLDARLVSLLSPMSQPAESFRALRTAVQFSRPDAVVTTILVTSASPSEGKSTVAANLAIVMAQAGRRTVLVDADLRRPRVHREFGVRREPGLVDFLFLSQSEDPGQAQPLIPDVADDLDVLPAGRTAPNPAELLGSRALRDLLTALSDHYDVVVIDAPPVLAATDPVLLSTQADATILVARAGVTKDYELQYAIEQLQSVGSKTIGTVLNGFDATTSYGYKYRYTYGYTQKYSYGHEDAE